MNECYQIRHTIVGIGPAPNELIMSLAYWCLIGGSAAEWMACDNTPIYQNGVQNEAIQYNLAN
jgi:hypothetical protein